MLRGREVSIIVAVSENDAIGKDGELLFKLKGDMEHFKSLTTGNVVIMGRKTFESIGHPLKDRLNVVITSQEFPPQENVVYVRSFVDALVEAFSQSESGTPIFIIGGGQVYNEALTWKKLDRIYLTRVKKEVADADTFFPKLDYVNEWYVKSVESHEEGNIGYDICVIEHRK